MSVRSCTRTTTSIEYNEIHHAMEILGDGNGIYIRGAGAGNVIRRNYIHHLGAPMFNASGDPYRRRSRDTLIAENLIYKCMAQGHHSEAEQPCENNIVADVLRRHAATTCRFVKVP